MNQAVVNDSVVTMVAARGCVHSQHSLYHTFHWGPRCQWAEQSNFLSFAMLSPKKVKEIKNCIYFKETFMLQINQETEMLKVLPQL